MLSMLTLPFPADFHIQLFTRFGTSVMSTCTMPLYCPPKPPADVKALETAGLLRCSTSSAQFHASLCFFENG